MGLVIRVELVSLVTSYWRYKCYCSYRKHWLDWLHGLHWCDSSSICISYTLLASLLRYNGYTGLTG